MAKKKLKMTKKCIAARRRYRAKKAGVPTGTRKAVRRKRPTGTRRRGHGTRGSGFFKNYGLDNPILTSFNSGVGAGFRKKRRRGRKGRGRGRGASKRGPEGAGFWEDLGHTMTTIGQTALSILPMLL